MASEPFWWAARLDYTALAAVSDADREAITATLPDGGQVAADSATRRISLTFPVEVTSLRQATDAALRAAHRAAPAGAEAAAVHVAPHVEQQAAVHGQAPGVSIVGTVEAAPILGVSRRRLVELVDTHPEFPAPAARLTVGRVWTRAAIETFAARWRGADRPAEPTQPTRAATP
jgi:hypothetical protein